METEFSSNCESHHSRGRSFLETALMSDIVVPPNWRDRLEELAGRRRDVFLVAAVVLAVALGAFVLRSRAAEPRIAPPATAPPANAPPETGAPSGTATATPPVTGGVSGEAILVHVAGAVKRPGLYELPAGARIADAIDVARGPRSTANLNGVNLAEPLVDGQKLDVPRKGEAVSTTTTTGAAPGTTTPATTASGAVNLNTADQVELETIPGIGPVTASAIIAYRTEIGQFDSIDQLLDVTGIGPATLESMRAYITL